MKFFLVLLMLAVLYLACGVVARILYCKKSKVDFTFDKEALLYIIMWPKNL